MLALSHPVDTTSSSSPPLRRLSARHGVMDESGTIDPSALNAPTSTISPNLLSQPSPARGLKRSRSPDSYGVHAQESAIDDNQSNKRTKSLKATSSPSTMTTKTMQHAVQTPQIKTEPLPLTSPGQASPTQSTPGSASKPAVVKALPTVRDHTTDVLGPEGDEYLARETDPDGENKVTQDGMPLDGRKFRCRTFKVPNRGEKLFMLATECARVLGYRDSYLLFNKNRSLFKIIANTAEKEDLIHQEILPYSYRSRQIAIVTARSMFRQFGSRLVENGRRVRDDYWETKAKKQGFTEDDAAGEKRPGAAKAREAAAAEASHAALTSLPHGEIIYSNGPGMDSQPPGLDQVSLAPLAMIHLPSDELRPGAYGNMIRPRQEVSGLPYHDRTQPSGAAEILSQAAQAAEFNKQISQTRTHRADYLDDYWRRPHEQPAIETAPETTAGAVAPSNLHSPQAAPHLGQPRLQQPHDQMGHVGPQLMQQAYPAYNQQNPMASPVQSMHRAMPPTQMQHGSPPLGMGGAAPRQQTQTPNFSGYGAPTPNQMWPGGPPQPQPSPLSQSHHVMQQQHQQQPQHSPYGQQQLPPQRPQSTQMLPPSMPQQSSMQYSQMSAGPNAFSNAYSHMNHGGLYGQQQQPSPGPQQFSMQGSASQQQGGMQGWAAQGGGPTGLPQDWQRY